MLSLKGFVSEDIGLFSVKRIDMGNTSLWKYVLDLRERSD